MAQIVPGTNWAEQLGQGLGVGLNQLAQNKINQLQQRHAHMQKTQAYTGLGFSPQEAQALSSLPDKLQQLIIPAYLERGGAGAQQQEQPQEQAGIEQLLQQPQQQMGQASPQAIQQNLAGMPKQFQVNPMENALQSILGQGQRQPVQSSSVGGQVQAAPIIQQQEAAKAIAPALSKAERISQHQAKRPSITEVLSRPSAKEIQAERKAEAKLKPEQSKAIEAEAKPYIKKLTLEKDQADFAGPRLNEMKRLIKRGKLPSAAEYKILKGLEEMNPLVTSGAGAALGAGLGAFGGPLGITAGYGLGSTVGAGIGAVLGPVATILHNFNKATFAKDEEKFEKLSASFLKGMKDIFGARISNAEMNAFLTSIPTLGQTDAGKLSVIEDMELFNKAAEVKYKAMRQIIKENGGVPPANLQDQVEERSQYQLNKLSEIFKKDLS